MKKNTIVFVLCSEGPPPHHALPIVSHPSPTHSMLRRLRGHTWDSEPEEPEGGESSPERVLTGLRAVWQASPVKKGGDESPGAEDHCELADCSWAAEAKPGAGTLPAQKAQGQAAGGSPPGGCREPPPCLEFEPSTPSPAKNLEEASADGAVPSWWGAVLPPPWGAAAPTSAAAHHVTWPAKEIPVMQPVPADSLPTAASDGLVAATPPEPADSWPEVCADAPVAASPAAGAPQPAAVKQERGGAVPASPGTGAVLIASPAPAAAGASLSAEGTPPTATQGPPQEFAARGLGVEGAMVEVSDPPKSAIELSNLSDKSAEDVASASAAASSGTPKRARADAADPTESQEETPKRI